VQDFSVTVNKLMVTNIREQISEMFPLPSLLSTGWFKEWKLSMIYKAKKTLLSLLILVGIKTQIV